MRDGLTGGRLTVCAVAVLVLAACTLSPEAENAAALAKAEGHICKRVTPIGSNMPQRVCASEEEWAEREKSGREQFEELRRDARATNASNFPQ